MSRKDERKKEIEKLFEEGYAACYAGKHIQTCPHKYMDEMHWVEGFEYAYHEIHSNESAEVLK